MKATEIRELSIKDLKERIETEKANLMRLKMNHAVSPLDDLSQINKAKTNIARMLTILSQMENKKDN
ncbi:MAG: 50S ribosomal protein L29 [Bacteroidetes bacterium GWE2_39_28]|jgi:large subunit ribosomal protein L29|nr:50S ribosomal protein L29 [Bacteroidales bacterium]OFX76673.1 MAG: 50S ribosomal protein L29 [Bacteroidetes bacterium GWE2_39_28]OFY12497.1 MAG: 50S ribosomal protein L29 [Bacteroidetes bacterium GWF2_39_10]OFZ07236.1 MAG: 50S ribosomal protein L29 [Bacteroidetes bacterium RIFOXYB2_FULL_39_7]OFZ10644.1 MAG: 50S ribosomal protein L29 [Bacteroidetes bacterium RIFOXYC2_FULL_39_11]PKO96179.1 MAG: 50S ribosomal protein L29 [Bacteroidetes bacterium HGW-Bacteroidetes-7]HCT93448.1 50S ribosomal pr